MSLLGKIKKAVISEDADVKKKEIDHPAPDQKPVSPARATARGDALMSGIVRRPHVTEKAAALQEQGKYVFQVAASANKIEVKKAIAHMFGVRPVAVHIARKPERRVRLGKYEGKVPGFKKAIITLKEGDRIDMGV
ncbi:MAG: 50S ribosomal protein L23 [Patescibacteria group bacterium]